MGKRGVVDALCGRQRPHLLLRLPHAAALARDALRDHGQCQQRCENQATLLSHPPERRGPTEQIATATQQQSINIAEAIDITQIDIIDITQIDITQIDITEAIDIAQAVGLAVEAVELAVETARQQAA